MAGINNSTGLYTPNTIIVDSAGTTPFTTIAEGIAAAVVLGANTVVYVRAGTYTENLTLVDGINITGCDEHEVIIDGLHTLPATGSCTFSNIKLTQSTPATNLFTEAGANDFHLYIKNCFFNIDSGIAFNMPLSTGSVTVIQCTEISPANSIIDNTTGACSFIVVDSAIGTGTVAAAIAGYTRFIQGRFNCPITLSGTAAAEGINSTFSNLITLADTATLTLSGCRCDTGANVALDVGATSSAVLADVVINSAAANVITGLGSCEFAGVLYQNSTAHNVTTADYTTRIEAGELQLDAADTGCAYLNAGLLTPAAMTDGQLLIGSTGVAPVVTTLTAGAGTTITEAAGSITIAATAGFVGTFIPIAVDGALTTNTAYINTKVAALSVSLPAVSAVGDVLILQGSGAGGWTITQAVDQQIHIGNQSSTAGAAGNIASTHANDNISLVCVVENLEWATWNSFGNIDVI